MKTTLTYSTGHYDRPVGENSVSRSLYLSKYSSSLIIQLSHMTMSCSCSGVLKARCQKQDKCSPSIDFNNITQWQPEYRNVLNPGEFGISKENVVYLTSVGKASSLQKDRETKRTPAGVAGGRLVISCSSCSASSSVGLGQDHSKRIQLNQKFQSILLFSTSETTNIHSVNKKRTKVFC